MALPALGDTVFVHTFTTEGDLVHAAVVVARSMPGSPSEMPRVKVNMPDGGSLVMPWQSLPSVTAASPGPHPESREFTELDVLVTDAYDMPRMDSDHVMFTDRGGVFAHLPETERPGDVTAAIDYNARRLDALEGA